MYLNRGTTPQVCDRCRIKKIGCDGNLPSCGKCSSLNVECTRSTSLLRKTMPRRYGKRNVPDEIQRLKSQISELQDAVLQQQRQIPISTPASGMSTLLSPHLREGCNPPRKSTTATGSVIKHLGRLVSVAPGQDFFAGSTTGVHFIRSVEQKWLNLSGSSAAFPDFFFRMHLMPQPTMLYPGADDPAAAVMRSGREDLRLPVDYYLDRIQTFLTRWNKIFLVFCRNQIVQTFEHLLSILKSVGSSEVDKAALHSLYLILAIDAWGTHDLAQGQEALEYYTAATKLEPEALDQLNLFTVQAYLLKTIYLLLSGKHALITCTVGSMVRAAQCIGLHRQSRRFKLCAGEAEYRTRLWWCVSILDTLTAINYGLPKIINDSDVDVLAPTDCDFDNMLTTQLPVPLPGETTQSATFIALVKLHKIMQQAIQLLFTTTERRDGERKIDHLERQIRVWRYENAHLTENNEFSAYHLDLLSHFCMLLVHHPGLTMDENSEQIDRSMHASVESSLGVLHVLTKAKHERLIFYLQPGATRMVLQSAMMCLYFAWHKQSTDLPADDGSTAQTYSLDSAVEMACSLLDIQRHDLAQSHTLNYAMAQHELAQATAMLRDMVAKTYIWLGQIDRLLPGPIAHVEQVAVDDPIVGNPADLSSLWDLNTTGLEEWSEGLQLGSMDQYLLDFDLE